MEKSEFRFPKDVNGWLSSDEGKLLYELAQLNPDLGRVVELGSFHGRSTICLAQGSKKVKGGKVFTVDTFTGGKVLGRLPDYYLQFKQNIKSYQVANSVMAIQEDTVKAAKKWKGPIRLLFIDASHFYQDVINDYQAWEKHVVSNGIIAFHDCRWPGVYKAIDELIKFGKIKDIRVLKGKDFTGLAYGIKAPAKRPVPWFKKRQSLLVFKFIFLPDLGRRFRHYINERGKLNKTDFWFRFFGTLGNFWKKLRFKRR